MTQGTPVLILLVEDDLAHAEIVRRSLAESRVASRIVHVEDGQAALDYLWPGGTPVGEGLLNRIEMVVRSYDPCFSCAAHAFPGPGSLAITLRDHRGAVVGRLGGAAAPPATRA